MDQLPATSPKYQAVLDWFDEHDRAGNSSALRHPHDVAGSAPAFASPAALPLGAVGQPYSAPLAISGGNGALTWETLAVRLPAGLVWNEATRTVSGTPTAAGVGRLFARVHDADGDAAWRLFTLDVVAPGGPLAPAPLADASVIEFSGNADTNFGAAQQLNAINPLFDTFFTNPPNPASADGAKTYLKFDLTSLRQAGLSVASATLELHPTQPAGENARVVAYATADENWTESAITFNARPAAVLSSPAVFGQTPPGLHAPVSVVGEAPVQLPITALVQTALAGSAPTVSVVIAAADYNPVPNFASREHFDPTRHPRLRLVLGGSLPPDTLENFSHFSIHAGEAYLAWPAAPGIRVQRNTSATFDPAAWITLPATDGLGGFAEPFTGNRVFYRLIRQP
jgi:hypothetical protein